MHSTYTPNSAGQLPTWQYHLSCISTIFLPPCPALSPHPTVPAGCEGLHHWLPQVPSEASWCGGGQAPAQQTAGPQRPAPYLDLSTLCAVAPSSSSLFQPPLYLSLNHPDIDAALGEGPGGQVATRTRSIHVSGPDVWAGTSADGLFVGRMLMGCSCVFAAVALLLSACSANRIIVMECAVGSTTHGK